MSFENPLAKSNSKAKLLDTQGLVQRIYGDVGLALLKKMGARTRLRRDPQPATLALSEKEARLHEAMVHREKFLEIAEKTAQNLVDIQFGQPFKLNATTLLLKAHREARLPLEKAQSTFDEKMQEYSEEERSPYKIGLVYLAAGDTKRAQEICDTSETYFYSDKALLNLKLLQEELGRGILSEDHLRQTQMAFRLIFSSSDFPSYIFDDVHTFLRLSANTPVPATELFQQLHTCIATHSYDESDKDDRYAKSKYYTDLGITALLLNRPKEARDCFAQIQSIDERFLYQIVNLKVALGKNEVDAAETLFHQSITLLPDVIDPKAIPDLVQLALQLPNPLGALHKIHEIADGMHHTGTCTTIYDALISGYLILGKQDLATACLTKMEETAQKLANSFQTYPTDFDQASCHIALAHAYQQLGKDPQSALLILQNRMLLPNGKLHEAFIIGQAPYRWMEVIDALIAYDMDPTALLEAMKQEVEADANKSISTGRLFEMERLFCIFTREVTWGTKRAQAALEEAQT